MSGRIKDFFNTKRKATPANSNTTSGLDDEMSETGTNSPGVTSSVAQKPNYAEKRRKTVRLQMGEQERESAAFFSVDQPNVFVSVKGNEPVEHYRWICKHSICKSQR